ncbi:MAG: hypothetical protein JO328_21265 [Hyphomicrobiales bacterium]|nr:hypothetical protein [Hyphomicrobiales bacterium]MBV9429096.1 hypothetical protein [Bradyrhizobiaceae bacterium]
MSDLPIRLKQETARAPGRSLVRTEARFVPSGEGSQERARADLATARAVRRILDTAFPGHDWEVLADSRQGYVAFRIPTLMGANWAYLIKGRELTPEAVLKGGGELLERYRLPRGKFDLDRFLEARAAHSILLDRRRKVPE